MALDQRKYERKHTDVLRDIRPGYVRLGAWLKKPSNAGAVFLMGAFGIYTFEEFLIAADFVLLFYIIYFFWLMTQDRSLAFKLPFGAKWKDKKNMGPGKKGQAEGILYLGNLKDTREEVWFSNSDARTHILYLGTTGSGKTEGLKSMVSNALSWGSGFIYIDGKADTDLWSSLSSLVRRFGRDDDLLVLNYMTGNSDTRAPSNTMNPFSSGSASYLTNMLVSLMPEAEGDNAMWKERAVALIASLMPALTWKRDNQEIPLAIGTIRQYLNLNSIVKLSRDQALPPDLRAGVKGYLDTLPGYVDAAFDDEGREKPAGPDQPAYDTTTARQQHGYLSMQFTRALQSLGDEYGYIFDTQAADVDMVDVVLNRRILVVLIPALEKSSDETANLGKIVAATLKGMMGSTLGSSVEGESATVIENKPTHSSTPFMTVFDEVGYYTAQGMAVMAAQARSLGFCLVYSAQDLPALEKRVKEEARSITANCNIKIFGKLEDPTQTKEFFEKTVGSAMVMESSGFQLAGSRGTGSYHDTKQAGLQIRARASYDGLRAFKEGEAVIAFGDMVVDTAIFYSNPGHAKAMRVTRFMILPPPDENVIKHAQAISKVRDLMVHKTWTAMKASAALDTPEEFKIIDRVFTAAKKRKKDIVTAAMAAVAGIHAHLNPDALKEEEVVTGGGASPAAVPPVVATPSAPPPPSAPASPLVSPLGRRPDPPLTSTEPPVQGGNGNGNGKKNGGPMTFFKRKPAGGTVSAPEAAPAKSSPVSWEDLIKATGKTEAAEDPPPAAPPPPPETLIAPDAEAADILKKAGQDAMQALFKKKDRNEDGNNE